MKRIVIEFKDKGRTPAVTEYMPAEEAEQEFGRLTHMLGRSGTEGDQWITVGKTVAIRAQEVHNVTLADQVGDSPAFYYGDDEDSISNRQF